MKTAEERKRKAEADLRNAKRAAWEHSTDCAAWDYESSNGCRECDRHGAAVIRARLNLVAITNAASNT